MLIFLTIAVLYNGYITKNEVYLSKKQVKFA